jgi:pyridoxal phosphate enzyme (YggS family)
MTSADRGAAGRAAELRANLAELTARIERACAAAHRDRSELTLVAVTKTFPASDVRLLAELGITDVGENRDQDAAAKYAECAGLGLRWHFVGQLQRNKARSVATYADVVHSVDRPSLVEALSRAAVAAGREVVALVQVSLDPAATAAGRGGAPPGEVEELATAIAAAPSLHLGGVMAVAPLGAPPEVAFATLAEVAAAVQARHRDARIVSAGMTGDLEAAIANGATHLRVGTALLGRRSPPVG